jgi:hypothetical protein
MNDVNPYQSPQTESTPPDASRQPNGKRHSRLVWLQQTVLIGAVVGSLVLAPFLRCPGDPSGHSIGAGIGGFAALGIGILVRALFPESIKGDITDSGGS